MEEGIIDEKYKTMLEANELYKRGDYVLSYEKSRNLIADGNVPEKFYLTCAWILYRYIKQMAGPVSLGNLRICSEFFVEKLSRTPCLVRSLFLFQMIEISKVMPQFDFLEFCSGFDITKLREDDFVGRDVTGTTKVLHYESLAEKLATRLYNVMKSQVSKEYAMSLIPFFRMVKEKCSQNKFVDMYLGLLYYWSKDISAAKRTFVEILITNPQWYIWKNMVLVADDREEKIAYCCKACSMMRDENYIGGLHLQLATLLFEVDKPHAAMEIGKFMDTYKRNNWRICGDALVLQNKLQNVTPATDDVSFYKHYAEKAETIVYGDIKQMKMEYERNVLRNGKTKALLKASDSNYMIIAAQSLLGHNAVPGDVFLVRCSNADRPLVLTISFLEHARKLQRTQANGEKTVCGIVTLPHNGGFAFIDNIYFVPDRICRANSLVQGEKVKAIARQMYDGRWRVVRILMNTQE